MLKKSKLLISEIENLCVILQGYCDKNNKVSEIHRVQTLTNCIYDKVEELYMILNNQI